MKEEQANDGRLRNIGHNPPLELGDILGEIVFVVESRTIIAVDIPDPVLDRLGGVDGAVYGHVAAFGMAAQPKILIDFIGNVI